jgi:DNA-binding MarR family transcriptional regulator
METEAPPEAVAFVRVLRASMTLRRALETRLLAAHRMTISDYEALLVLRDAEEGAMRRVDLAQRLLLSPSGVTRLLEGLQRLGLVENAECSHDRRVSYAVITADGRKALECATEAHHAALREELGEQLTPEELATLTDLLGRIPGVDEPEACPLDATA